MADAMGIEWLQLFSAALGGGLTVKTVDIIYQEARRRRDQTKSATKFVDEHMDPLLKAADEVVRSIVRHSGQSASCWSHRTIDARSAMWSRNKGSRAKVGRTAGHSF